MRIDQLISGLDEYDPETKMFGYMKEGTAPMIHFTFQLGECLPYHQKLRQPAIVVKPYQLDNYTTVGEFQSKLLQFIDSNNFRNAITKRHLYAVDGPYHQGMSMLMRERIAMELIHGDNPYIRFCSCS